MRFLQFSRYDSEFAEIRQLVVSGQCSKIAITGPVHCGKTSVLKELFSFLKHEGVSAAGFIESAKFLNNHRTGYEFCDLNTNETCIAATFNPAMNCYDFPETAWIWAQNRMKLYENASVFMVDELGRLESEGRGLMPILLDSVGRMPRELIGVVRESVVDEIERRLGKFDYILRVEQSGCIAKQ